MVDLRIVAPGIQWERPFSRRHQFGGRSAITSDEDGLALKHEIEEAREVSFRIVDVVTGHDFSLARFGGQVEVAQCLRAAE